MNNDDNMNSISDDSITISLGDPVDTISFTSEPNATGYIAQEISSITFDSNMYTASNNFTINTGNTNWAYQQDMRASTISTDKHTIDIDELAEVFETVKKRLLILTPNFEMHEKYPMLKQMYDEYKAMEALLSGPESNE